MDRFSPVHLVVVLCGLLITGFESPAVFSSIASDPPVILKNPGLPKPMIELIRTVNAKYLEGSRLIKAGDSDEARKLFNEAVDLLLQSNWDLTTTPVLNAYFQEVITEIKNDESQYLAASCDPPEETENAVVDELEGIDLIPIKINTSLEHDLISDLAKTKYEIPITINEMVLKSLDFWLNRGRKHFVDGLLRSGRYRSIIEKVFQEESIPLDLMYLAQVESLFKPTALSRAKAKGIWQFGEATARRYGLKVTRDVDERSDPEKSTRAAARYLKDLFKMFGDWNLVLAAYNWGEGKVQRLINSTGLNDFWQLVDLRRKVPQETKNHVPLIQASVILARNPEKYGLPTKLDPPLKYSEVSVSKPIDLRAAAKVLSTTLDELKKLNPALRGFTTPANYPNFKLKVPADTDPDTHEQLASLPAARPKAASVASVEGSCRHKVRRGETLSGIARKYGTTVAKLRNANNLGSESRIVAGSWLQIPGKSVEAAGDASKRNIVSGKTKSRTAKTTASKKKSVKKPDAKQIAAR